MMVSAGSVKVIEEFVTQVVSQVRSETVAVAWRCIGVCVLVLFKFMSKLGDEQLISTTVQVKGL